MALLVLALLVAGCGGGNGSTGGGSTGGNGSSGGGSSAANGLSGGGGPGGSESIIVGRAEKFGSEVSGSEAKGPEAALLGYHEARANGEWSKACSYLSKDLLRIYSRLSKKGGCANIIEKTTKGLSSKERSALAEVEVESVRLEGDSGYVIFTTAEGSRRARPVEKEGGAWKLSSALTQAVQRASQK